MRDALFSPESQFAKPVSSGSLSEVQDSGAVPTGFTWDVEVSLAPREGFGQGWQPLFTFPFSHLAFKSSVKNSVFSWFVMVVKRRKSGPLL